MEKRRSPEEEEQRARKEKRRGGRRRRGKLLRTTNSNRLAQHSVLFIAIFLSYIQFCGSALILVGWLRIRIQVGKKTHTHTKKRRILLI